MASSFMSKKQEDLFQEIETAGELVFACGPAGVSANIVGQFRINKIQGKEDRLEMGDGTNHVHIDWGRVKRVELDIFYEEGMLIFYDGDEILFKLYRPEGRFSDRIKEIAQCNFY